jgi:toxin ParE1/3/4
MASVLFSESAKADLLEAWLFIAEESVVSADDLIDAIHQEVKILSLQPLMGRV